MNELVTVIENDTFTNSLAIAEGVGKPHKSVIRLIRDNLQDFQAHNPVRFENALGKSLPQGGFAASTEYAVLDERQATLLMTYFRNNPTVKIFKNNLVDAFFKMREMLKSPPSKPLTERELLQRQLESLDKIEKLETQIEQDKPKVDFYEKVARMDGDLSVAEAAKLIGTGQKTLMAFMREKEWVNRKNEPFQAKISKGWMDVKMSSYMHPEDGIQHVLTPRVKPKGLIELRKLWESRFEM